MKKYYISLMIIASLGLVGCGSNNTDTKKSSINNINATTIIINTKAPISVVKSSNTMSSSQHNTAVETNSSCNKCADKITLQENKSSCKTCDDKSLSDCKTLHITKAFFGDKEKNRVIVIDVEKMELIKEAYTEHNITYTAFDIKLLPKVYVSNRGSNAIDVVDAKSMEIVKTIQLQHYPRSADALNEELGLISVSGMNKPMISIIDINTDEVIATVGDDNVTGPVQSSNGSHACGHPYWLNKNHFVLIDRANKTLATYKISKDDNNTWSTQKINTINTPTTAHQLVPRKHYDGDKNLYYLINDGSDEINPSIMELNFDEEIGLQISRELQLTNDLVDVSKMGAHHGDFAADCRSLYVGSKEGTMFIIDYDKMEIETTLQAGYGAGHTKMIPKLDLAIVINHKDKFVTAVNTATNEAIKNIPVSNLPDSVVTKKTIQAHSDYFVSDDDKYFYMFLTEEADFIKIDLDSLEVIDRLNVGGKPTMGTFI